MAARRKVGVLVMTSSILQGASNAAFPACGYRLCHPALPVGCNTTGREFALSVNAELLFHVRRSLCFHPLHIASYGGRDYRPEFSSQCVELAYLSIFSYCAILLRSLLLQRYPHVRQEEPPPENIQHRSELATAEMLLQELLGGQPKMAVQLLRGYFNASLTCCHR